eukprot:scaffold4.g4723.t1
MAQPSASCDVFAGSSFYADTVAKAQALAPERRPPEVTAFLQAHELLEQADAGQPRPLNHLRLPSDQRFAALLSPLKFTVVFDTDESHASRMEMRFSTAKMKDLVRQPSAGAPPPLVRSARLATNLLLLADRELLEADYASARQLLDAVHRSLNDPGAAAVINAQLEAMRRGAALARESSDGAGATSAGGEAARRATMAGYAPPAKSRLGAVSPASNVRPHLSDGKEAPAHHQHEPRGWSIPSRMPRPASPVAPPPALTATIAADASAVPALPAGFVLAPVEETEGYDAPVAPAPEPIPYATSDGTSAPAAAGAATAATNAGAEPTLEAAVWPTLDLEVTAEEAQWIVAPTVDGTCAPTPGPTTFAGLAARGLRGCQSALAGLAGGLASLGRHRRGARPQPAAPAAVPAAACNASPDMPDWQASADLELTAAEAMWLVSPNGEHAAAAPPCPSGAVAPLDTAGASMDVHAELAALPPINTALVGVAPTAPRRRWLFKLAARLAPGAGARKPAWACLAPRVKA